MSQSNDKQVHNTVKSWYVLYTKPRHEKKLADRLQSDGISVYCPMKKSLRVWSDRKKVVEEPLFPSFIFIQCEENRRDEVFAHPSAVRYLFWLRKPAVVRDCEINAIKHWMGEISHNAITVEQIPIGSRVRIKEGPLKDQLGQITEFRGGQTTIVLDQLGIQVRIKAHETPLMTA